MTRKKPVVHPPLKPYDWQEADIKHAVASISPEVGALVVSAPGAGKTLVATEIIKRLGADVTLIVAPQGTHKGAWGKTIARQGVADEVRVLIGDKKGKAAFADLQWGKPGVYVTTPQWFARQNWKGITPDAVIFDEVHMAGAYGNATQKKLHTLKSNIRIAMSGTPLRNKWENAWAIVRWIEPARMPLAYWIWRMSDCAKERDHWSPQGFKVTGELVPGKLFNSLGCYIIHKQREKCCKYHPNGFLAELEAPLEVQRLVQMHPEQAKFYKEMEQRLVSSLQTPDEDGHVPVVAEIPLQARGMLRFCSTALPVLDQETNKLRLLPDTISPKIDELILDLEKLDGDHVLVLTHSKQIAELALARIQASGYAVEAWHGDVTKAKREKLLEAFIGGEVKIIVGVISAMGTGTDGLQEVCNTACWLSLDEDGTNNEQGRGRLDRLGQRNQVLNLRYESDKTLDVGMYSTQLQAILKLNQSLKKEGL